MRLLEAEELPTPEEFRQLLAARDEAEASRAQQSDLLSHDSAAAIQAMATEDRRALQERMRAIVRQFESLEQMRADWVLTAPPRSGSIGLQRSASSLLASVTASRTSLSGPQSRTLARPDLWCRWRSTFTVT